MVFLAEATEGKGERESEAGFFGISSLFLIKICIFREIYRVILFTIVIISTTFSKCSLQVEVEMSEKREKFVSLAEKRVTRTIKDIRLIGNLSNKNNYSYEEKDVRKIISTLEDEIKTLKARFAADDVKSEAVFKL